MEPSWPGLTQNYPRLSHSLLWARPLSSSRSSSLICGAPALPCPRTHRTGAASLQGRNRPFRRHKAISTFCKARRTHSPGGAVLVSDPGPDPWLRNQSRSRWPHTGHAPCGHRAIGENSQKLTGKLSFPVRLAECVSVTDVPDSVLQK